MSQLSHEQRSQLLDILETLLYQQLKEAAYRSGVPDYYLPTNGSQSQIAQLVIDYQEQSSDGIHKLRQALHKVAPHLRHPVLYDDRDIQPGPPDTTRNFDRLLPGAGELRSEMVGELLVVETAGLDLGVDEGRAPGGAVVRAPNGCRAVLGWERTEFRWRELRERASEEKGKGTFWVAEMEQVMAETARRECRCVMTSTFRGRGDSAGKIFRPQLFKIDFEGERPSRFHFLFHEVLVPELVRGPDGVGIAFNLLYIVTRIRWEVMNPFLLNLLRENDISTLKSSFSEEERRKLIACVSRSLCAIDLQAERHRMLQEAMESAAFDGGQRNLIRQMLGQREAIKRAVAAAVETTDFEPLLRELMKALELLEESTEVLAARFAELVRADRARTRDMMRRFTETKMTG